MLSGCFGRSALPNDPHNAGIKGSPLYRCRVMSVIREGYEFSLFAKIPAEGECFAVDFNIRNTSKDIALRVIFRAATNSLSRSSRLDGVWSAPETCLESSLNLDRLKEFKMEIFFTEQRIYMAFNGIHLADYKHRAPYTSIHNIEIRGHLIDFRTDHNFIAGYPSPIGNRANCTYLFQNDDVERDIEPAQPTPEEPRFLILPYYAVFGTKFLTTDYSINVKGYVNPNPNSIKVSLQDSYDIWPEPNIAMQIEFLFTKNAATKTTENVAIFSSCIIYHRTDSRREVVTDLIPGELFDLLIVLGEISYKILLNNKQIHEYPFLINPIMLSTCCVKGDIRLIDVVAEDDGTSV